MNLEQALAKIGGKLQDEIETTQAFAILSNAIKKGAANGGDEAKPSSRPDGPTAEGDVLPKADAGGA